jgi:DNA-binding MurR/RpiR family transcriptional regulator
MKLQSGLVILKESLHTMSSGEHKIAQYILDNPQQLMELNISELAAQCGGSPAGIVRLCKRLNMKGYNELKLRVAMDLSREKDRSGGTTLKKDLPLEQLQSTIIENHIQALRSIETVLDIPALEEAAKIILKSRRIDIYGLGASGIVAQDLYQKLCRLGLSGFYVADSHMQITSSCSLTPRDTVIAISYSGETAEVIKAVQQARENGAATISLTRYGANTLEDMCAVNLFTPMNESLIREAAMTSRIAQLTVIDILFSRITAGNPERFRVNLDRSRQALIGEKIE